MFDYHGKVLQMFKKFKNMCLVCQGDSVIIQVLNKSLAEQRQHEEANKTKGQRKKGPNKKLQKEQTGSKTLSGGSMFKTVINHNIIEIILMKKSEGRASRKKRKKINPMKRD